MTDGREDRIERARRAALQGLEDARRAGLRWVRRRAARAGQGAGGQPAGAAPPPSPSPAAREEDAGMARRGQPERGGSRRGARRATAPAGPALFDQPADRPVLPRREREAALRALAAEVAGCARCAELAATRRQTVFGVGDPMARLCFLGEAPGADEDRQGEPFVGRAGQLLTRIIEACTLRREQVYILNVLKCRPPGNRTPTLEEAAQCRPFLDRQLDIIQPEFICCLGAVAARALLDTTQSLGRLRGRFYQYRGARVLVTYHPAYLLRNPAAKKDTWEDMQLLMREMGVPLPSRRRATS